MTARLHHLIAIVTSAMLALVSCMPMPAFVPGATGTLTASLPPHSIKKLRPVYAGDLEVSVDTGLAANMLHQSSRTGFSAKHFPVAGKRFRALHDGQVHPNPQQHAKDDTPYFTPDDPGSMAGVEPAEGDMSFGTTAISSMQVNGTKPTMAEAGVLLVLPASPSQTNLDAVLQQYGGEVQRQVGYFYQVKFDLSRVSLSNLEDRLRQVNQYVQTPITDVTFSSLQAAKLMKLAAELLATRQDLVAGIEFNTAAETPVDPAPGSLYSGNRPIHEASDSVGTPRLQSNDPFFYLVAEGAIRQHPERLGLWLRRWRPGRVPGQWLQAHGQ